jgi:threonine/homoserine/homoserine lactone efflux protein
MEMLVRFFTALLDFWAAVKAFFTKPGQPLEGIWTFEILFLVILLIAAVCGTIAFGTRQRRRRRTEQPAGDPPAED